MSTPVGHRPPPAEPLPAAGAAASSRLSVYAESTSVVQGGRLGLRIGRPRGYGRFRVRVHDDISGELVVDTRRRSSRWWLDVPRDWPSSLYRVTVTDQDGDVASAPDEAQAWFVVRPRRPSAPTLLSLPFTTWQAYNRFGVPGEGLYPAEDPRRAVRVSLDRPGGGPPPERWEHGLLVWLRRRGEAVDFCSNLDLHDGAAELGAYRLLVVNGHDEYWTWEMRDRVEGFVRDGGNLAVFGANTSWWQARIEDGGRSLVCYRDPTTDPIARTSPGRATVEWSSAPANRPENTMTGVSFRRGAGCWGPDMPRMREEAYTARFAEHWVFEGTGLRNGDAFALGTLGYETDAADFREIDGVPRVTGRDGTPRDFVVLATADLRHWRAYGQGGWATMGVFSSGAGTVFNAATVNWGAGLDDPVVDRVTRNVLARLSAPPVAGRWDVIGEPAPVHALVAHRGDLVAVGDGALLTRELCGQNLTWRHLADADGLVALAAPREAVPNGPQEVHAATIDGRLVRWTGHGWAPAGTVPAGTAALAIADCRIFAARADGTLWAAPLAADARRWTAVGVAPPLAGLTAEHGRLYAACADNQLRSAAAPPPDRPVHGWTALGPLDGVTVIAADGGRIVGVGPGRCLRWRTVTPAATA
ncbi:N,N-dimethylformamidase beta subunit family domain-containing protein [Micromonospora sp. NPDC051300]|uniref:N,N-dimethylformamidase beta subunit family domain-containing protein n=1 Tax=Micromonospora sp. NPDC051300 TaxID=3364286 RepID=UPI0037BA9D3B